MTTTSAIYLRPFDKSASLVTIESDPRGQAMWVIHSTPGTRETLIRQFHESPLWLYEDTPANRERARRIKQAYTRIGLLERHIERMRLEMEEVIVPTPSGHSEGVKEKA